jgi:hypothetical protein
MLKANEFRLTLRRLGYSSSELRNHQLWTHPDLDVPILLPRSAKMGFRYENDCKKKIKYVKKLLEEKANKSVCCYYETQQRNACPQHVRGRNASRKTVKSC